MNPRSSISSADCTASRDVIALQFRRVLRVLRESGRRVEVGEHLAGIHEHHANVEFPQLRAPALRHAAQRKLAPVVGGPPLRAPNGRGRTDVDDVAALPLDKMLCGLPCHQHGAGDIGGEHVFEAGEIHLDERLDHAEAGVVHQNVEVIEYLEQLPVGPQDVRFLCHVRADGMGANGSAGGGQPLVVAPRNGDFGAGPGQSPGNGETDAARSAGDQRC